MPHFAVDEDTAAALLHDAVDRGKAETGSGIALRGKERIENARLRFRIHAGARIGDAELNIVARGEAAQVALGNALVKVHVPGFDHELAAFGHRVPGVYGEIHDDLFHVPRIGFDFTQFGTEYGDQRNV